MICDVTRNGTISSLDAAYILQYVAGLRSFTSDQKLLADATGNGTVSAGDAAKILQYVAGLNPVSRCGQILLR
jgi:hypothetical protein